MNERIQELARQAVQLVADEQTKGDASRLNTDSYHVKDLINEKFAQLIVQHCAEICMEMSAKCAGLPGEGALAKDCAFWIKKDFGIK